MAVSNPLRYRIALVESTPLTRAFKYIVPAVLCSFVLNIPKFLEVEVSEWEGYDGLMGSGEKYTTFGETFFSWVSRKSHLKQVFDVGSARAFMARDRGFQKLLKAHEERRNAKRHVLPLGNTRT